MTNLRANDADLLGIEPVQVNGGIVDEHVSRDIWGDADRRPFLSCRTKSGRANVVVLGEALWRARFGADPAGGRPAGHARRRASTPIIGVAPRLPAFWDADVWTTNPFQYPGVPEDTIRRGFSYLAAGRPPEAGRLRSSRLVASWKCWRARFAASSIRGTPMPRGRSPPLSLRDDIVGASRSSLLTLLAAVGLLAGGRVRQRGESLTGAVHRPPAGNRASRAALGASRGRHGSAVSGREPAAERRWRPALGAVGRLLGRCPACCVLAQKQSRVCERHHALAFRCLLATCVAGAWCRAS